MFTTEHFIWIGICAAFIAVLTYISYRRKLTFRKAAATMAGIALGSETSKIVSHMEFVSELDAELGMVLDPEALPFHLCSLLIFAFFYLPFSHNEHLKGMILSLMVPVGLLGSLLAILMATSGTDFTKPEPYQCFIYHAGLTWFAIYLVMTRQVELGKKAWLRNVAILFCMAVCMIWVNSFLSAYDTNFWYVVRPPVDGLPLLNLDRGWFAYFGTLIALGFVGVTAVHLPFMVKERREQKQLEKVPA